MARKPASFNAAPPGSTAALFFLPGQLVFRRFEQGREVTKALLSEQVARAFHEFSADTGWLGRRVLRTLMGPRGSCVASCEPAGIRRVLCGDAGGEVTEVRVPFPSLVLFGRGRDYFLFATNDANPHPGSGLFVAPCPNVGSSDGGRVCFGRNEPPEASPDALEAVWELFWNSPFNGDHAAGKSRSAPEDVRFLWNALEGRRARRFPREELTPIAFGGRQLTIADVWQRLVREF